MASTSSAPSDMHGLTTRQLSELNGAVQALDAYLLLCVDELRNNRWVRPNTKHVADCLVRELVRNVAHRFQVRPITDTITRDHRTKLLTRRVRAIMRAFNKNPNYLSMTPNITWDDSFIPPELYDDLASVDAKESQQLQNEKARESQREEQMIKEKAMATQKDKGKTKETAQDKDDTEKPKRKWTQKTSESIMVFEVGTSDDEAEPPAKRVKRNKSIDDVGIIPVPPSCQQCTISRIECTPNGWSVACKNCQKSQRTCSLSKALQNDKGKAKETAEDIEKPDDTEKPKTQRAREIHTSIFAVTKPIPRGRSSSEDEDVDQLDESPAKPSPKKKKVSSTTMGGFIPYDPKCDRCEESHKECVRRDTQVHGASCMQCAKAKKGCNLTKGQSKINFIPNDPKCYSCEQSHKECVRRETKDHGTICKQCAKEKKECKYPTKGQSKIDFIPNDPECNRCERSHKECVRRETQDHGTRCRQCVKDHQVCKYLSKSQSKIIKSKPPPQPEVSNPMEEGSFSSSSPRNFAFERMQQQLKESQEDLRISQQQLQLANSRIEAERDLYEAQLEGYDYGKRVKQRAYESRRNQV